MRKVFVLLIVLTVLVACRTSQQFTPTASERIDFVESEDQEINDAIQQAQDTLPIFIAAFKNPSPTQTYFAIKVRFPIESDTGAEHMWLTELSLTDDGFEGILVSEPEFIKSVRLGDHLAIKTNDITDWMIIDNGKLLGGFTIYVFRSRMTDSEREQADKNSGLILSVTPALPEPVP
jgi:uncharacterized protein YegJ (DUF2314 family)